MARRIIMTGDEAIYIERRSAKVKADDDREIRMEGRHARYEETSVAGVAHFPVTGNEEAGRQWFDFLIKRGFIAPDTEISTWQYLMGFSTNQPTDVKPIEWMKTVETARLMLVKVNSEMLEKKQLSVVRMNELASQCFTKQGQNLKLSKPRKELSADADAIENFLPTISDF
ncbi:MAG: hypothetical protein IJ580_00415 [Prevotella sp.]|nr:hypothetical protein [Prevotella sp.]